MTTRVVGQHLGNNNIVKLEVNLYRLELSYDLIVAFFPLLSWSWSRTCKLLPMVISAPYALSVSFDLVPPTALEKEFFLVY